MVRRWIIRSVAILICAVCVGSFLLGTVFPMADTIGFGGEWFLRFDWFRSEVGLMLWNPHLDESGGYADWPYLNQDISMNIRLVYDHYPHFAGFGYTHLSGPIGNHVYVLRFPLWFPALLSVLLLVWVLRRTRRPSPVAAFPVEAKQTV